MWTILQAIKRSWSQHFVEQFSALLVMFMTYLALLFIAFSLGNVERLFDTWGQVNKVSIYLKPNTKRDVKESIEAYLKDQKMIHSFQRVSSEEAAKNFEKKFSKVSAQKLDSKSLAKFFPEYYVVSLNQTLAYKSGKSSLDNFVSQFTTTFESVKNVSYGKNWLQKYVSILSAVKSIGWFFIIAFLIAAVIVSSSVIKTSLYSRRDEIEIMEFIGASDAEIYLPQIVNSILLSVFAFCLAFFGLLGAHYQFSQSTMFGSAGNFSFISPVIVLVLFLLSVGSVMVYSTFTIFKLLPRRKQALLIKEVVK